MELLEKSANTKDFYVLVVFPSLSNLCSLLKNVVFHTLHLFITFCGKIETILVYSLYFHTVDYLAPLISLLSKKRTSYTSVLAVPYFRSLVMQILVTCSSLNARIFATGNFVRPQIHSLAVSHCISQ